MFHEYAKIERLGNPRTTQLLLDQTDDIIHVEEKIDGSNTRFLPLDGRIIYGSHHSSLGDSNCQINGNWKKCIDFLNSKLAGKDLSPYNGMIFFGEYCIPHSIQYNWDEIPPFIGFDIMQDGQYLPYIEKVRIFTELGLRVVPLLEVTTAGELAKRTVLESDIPQSKYGSIQAEGMVFKNYRTQTFLKFVSIKFKEVNRLKFGRSGDKPINDDEKLVKVYCTNARIDKQIFELLMEGKLLDMPLMQDLPKRVWADILEEHAREILMENWKLDLRNCRKMVANRCRAVLAQMISIQYVLEKPIEVK